MVPNCFIPILSFFTQPQNGGVVMVNFLNDFITCTKQANLSDVAGNVINSVHTIAPKLSVFAFVISRSCRNGTRTLRDSLTKFKLNDSDLNYSQRQRHVFLDQDN